MLILAHAAKALLFTSCVIATTNSQDLTEMGGLGRTMPITAGFVGYAGLGWILPLGGFLGDAARGGSLLVRRPG